ncbi:6-carboxytetrahydropterin synthase QueD [Actinobacillus pleuropneumoniae]|uniref:6-carboxy-5,6,7,8-tetrahydropterin synthase n=2 Tax=Actinobacillus pleuropneumoniae TaxID=715 RepID=A0A9Q4DHQ3_ACTPL|nr:6-carboxytetrahydropterin synthase QueD [Actinobacillus pleuropneumoniae]EFM91787.1 6-pyruvoyl tetrahydrobiopterin synthase [Actinobacillus pleuropneumoniae serovar 6 str. Femo]EFM96222.1 6-pyruvoyl tetrahydrobiopterin synthase [Actinobacillus pleuropneumoniae serovar 10 str. D13039]MCL7721009.1 6-carboxytetrahydropterin synthase QueD [Actinobacillus pleuropneumoniae]MCL7726513.1 6-carboxytetrahydropterin synthase QueD [Actinobacillus pleuropneumoniae]MCL7729017.1 6-carboxytetrahydropterin 
MFKIAKEFSFDMAHMLDGHDGKCQNLHGHTYKLQVEVSGDLVAEGAKRSMVMDYADLKSVVKHEILDPMDHAYIYDLNSERESQVAKLLVDLNSKVYGIPSRTTAEEMAKYMFEKLEKVGLPVSLIRLWETPTSYCEYSR